MLSMVLILRVVKYIYNLEHIRRLLEKVWMSTALNQAGVGSSGTADYFLKAANFTRTRQGYQIGGLALFKLQQDALMSTKLLHNKETIEGWEQKMNEKILGYCTQDGVNGAKNCHDPS